METRILHIYRRPMIFTSRYTQLRKLISLLKQKYIIDSYFAVVNDAVYNKATNEKFRNELIPLSEFYKNGYDVLIIEGSPQPEDEIPKIDVKIIKEFFNNDGIILHLIGVGDFNITSVPKINNFFKNLNLGLGIDTFLYEDDIIVGFDEKYKFGDSKEFIIEVGREYRARRTAYPEIFTGVEKLAVSDPIHQKFDLACKTLLTGNPTTQLVSKTDYIVDDRILEFGKVNEKGGFYILITGYLFDDQIITLIENDNLKFAENLFEYFINVQKERDMKLKMKRKKEN